MPSLLSTQEFPLNTPYTRIYHSRVRALNNGKLLSPNFPRLLTSPTPQPSERKSKRKRSGPDIITGIPVNEVEVVNEITVTRHKKRILTSSKPVHIPLPPTTQKPEVEMSPPDPPPRDEDVYSDVEDTNKSPGTNRHERKGQSRSVSVSISSCSRQYI